MRLFYCILSYTFTCLFIAGTLFLLASCTSIPPASEPDNTVYDVVVETHNQAQSERILSIAPTAEPTEKPTEKPTAKPTPIPTPKYSIEEAPYDMIDDGKVDFTTLINLNNRLDTDFVPRDLVRVSDYVDTELVTLDFPEVCANKTALMAFIDMIRAASDDGVAGFYLRNVYRSYNTQVSLWNKRTKADPDYGNRSGVPLGSAYPGSSEHQTGLAFDITSVDSPIASTAFMNTEQYKWLRSNSYKFGFILRYRSTKTDITGIKFEPYHYRYVGIKLAKKLYKSGMCLEEYYDTEVIWK